MNKFRVLLLFALVATLFSCRSSKPAGYKTDSGGISVIHLNESIPYERAYNSVIEAVASKYDLEFLDKDAGYGRTKWIYTLNDKGKYNKKYRVQVSFKFSYDKTRLTLKADAQYGGESKWVNGYDSDVLKQLKQDIEGTVGITTR